MNRLEMENGKILHRVGGVRGDGTFFIPDVCLRGKKRRLDHLTWEEKVQRKKLKNRVAAQTSRDRKKAKLDELEETVKMLRDRNDLLTRECSTLRSENESLVLEVKRLLCRDRLGRSTDGQYCVMCQSCVERDATSVGSAVSLESPPQQDPNPLPPLEELFGDLQADDYIDRLEKLAESLLREVTVDTGASPRRVLDDHQQVPFTKECDERMVQPKKMVGQASKNVETVAAGCGDEGAKDVASTLSVGSHRGTYRLGPTKQHCTGSPVAEGVALVKKEFVPTTSDTDTVYGTYDESTNCITIIYPNDTNDGNQVPIEECVQVVEPEESAQSEDSTCSNVKCSHIGGTSPAYTCIESMSPSSVQSEDTDVTNSSLKKYNNSNNLSDLGYESHDSPSVVESYNFHASSNAAVRTSLTDLWHESLSELFPSLA